MNHPIQCRCGTLQGVIAEVSDVNHAGKPLVTPRVLTGVEHANVMSAVHAN